MPQLVTPRLASQLQRRTAEAAYTDFGYYIPEADTTTLDGHGQPTASTERVPVTCSFNDKPSPEKWAGFADVQQLEGEARWATPKPTKGGKFILSERFEQHVEGQTFEIIGVQDRGAFGYVCALKAVTT